MFLKDRFKVLYDDGNRAFAQDMITGNYVRITENAAQKILNGTDINKLIPGVDIVGAQNVDFEFCEACKSALMNGQNPMTYDEYLKDVKGMDIANITINNDKDTLEVE